MSKRQQQEYLHREIIQKQYDSQEFFEYLTSFILQQNQQADIEKEIQGLTLDQLKIIVQGFVAMKTHKQEDNQQFDDFQMCQNVPTQPASISNDLDWGLLAINSNKQQKKQRPLQIKQPIPKHPKKQVITTSFFGEQIKSPPLPKAKQQQQIYISTKVNQQQSPKKQPAVVNIIETSKIFEQVLSNDNTFKSKINCLKLQQNILQHHLNINFTITEMRFQDKQKTYINKFFKGSHIVYALKTQGRNKQNAVGIAWTVKRKYSDFEWLKNALIKFYPGLIIPPLPKQAIDQSQMVQISAKNKFEYFLKEVYKQKQLRNSKYFEVFLSYINNTDFEAFKKNCENLSKPKTLNHVLNMTGQVQCNFNSGLNSYVSLMTDYVSKSTVSMKKIRQICKEISFIYDNLALKFYEFSQVCNQLRLCTESISQVSKDKKQDKEIKCFKKLTNTYKYLTQLVIDHAQMALKEKKKINGYFSDYFSYEKAKVENINVLIDKRNEFSALYAKTAYNPSSKNSSMFSKFSAVMFGDKQQYIDTPSTNFQTLKNQFGFFNSQVLKQTLKFIQNEVSSYIQHFTVYENGRIDMIDEQQSYWSRKMVDLSKLNIDTFF